MSFIYALETTYNNSSIIYNGIALNISNGQGGIPSYASGSYAVNIKNNGSTVFGVDPLGNITSQSVISPNLLQSITSPPFNAVGDGTTNNSAAFAAIQASSIKQFYVPFGNFFTNGSLFALEKQLQGPGQFSSLGGDALPGNFSNIHTLPTNTQTHTHAAVIPYVFQGDLSHIQPEYWKLDNVRSGLDTPYYCSVTIPHYQWFDNRAGDSGTISRTTAPAIIGATSVTVNSIVGLSIGMQIGFAGGSSPFTDTPTIVAPLAGTTVNFTPALASNYPSGTFVTNSYRTNNSLYYQQMIHRGAGDCYAVNHILENNYSPLPGQDHCFYTSTLGAIGGVLSADFSGVYLQSTEYQFIDNNNDIMVINDVKSFNRENNTGARGAYWLGTYFQSVGSKAADVGHAIAGPWQVALDTTRAVFTNNYAIQLAQDQKIVFNAAADNSLLFPLWGTIPGDTYEYYDHVAGTFKLVVGGAVVFQGTAAGSLFVGNAIAASLFSSGLLNSTGGVNAFTGTAISAGGVAGRGFTFFNATNFGVFGGSGAPTLAAAKGSLYLRSDGTGVNDRAYINTDGGTTWTAIVTVA